MRITQEIAAIGRGLALSRAPGLGLAAVGVFWGVFAALVPDLKAGVNASDAQFGVALLCASIGGILSMWAAPRVNDWLGKPVLSLVGVTLAAASFYPLWAASIWGMYLALFGMGMSVALLDISANLRISVLEARAGKHLMNMNHALFSLGFGAAALVTGLARTMGARPGDILPVSALVLAALAALMWQGRGAQELGGEDEPTSDARMPWTVILLTAVILFSSFVGENAAEAWSALHIERTLGGLPGEGGYGPATLGFTMAFVRFGAHIATARLGEERVVLYSAVLGVIGSLAIAAALSPRMVVAGVAIVGVGMAVIVPSANSILGKRVRHDQRSFALSRAWMIGFVGYFAGPSLLGFVAELTSLRGSFAVAAGLIALIIPAVLRIGREKTRAG